MTDVVRSITIPCHPSCSCATVVAPFILWTTPRAIHMTWRWKASSSPRLSTPCCKPLPLPRFGYIPPVPSLLVRWLMMLKSYSINGWLRAGGGGGKHADFFGFSEMGIFAAFFAIFCIFCDAFISFSYFDSFFVSFLSSWDNIRWCQNSGQSWPCRSPHAPA